MPTVVNDPAPSQIWRIVDLSYPSAFQNLALEEALARCSVCQGFRPTLRLWVDPPTVVVGRFQNVKAEVDTALCEQNDIKIARRFTGGGAVFHDEGNLNFTLVMRRPQRILLTEFHEFNSSVILDLLETFGLVGVFLQPNSILVSGKKISGAAAALSRDFAFWHSSILISTNTHILDQVLSPSTRRSDTSFIRSKWLPVTTIEAALGKPIGNEEVKTQLVRSFEKLFGARFEGHGLSKDEELRMRSLYDRKYSSPDWNLYGFCREEGK